MVKIYTNKTLLKQPLLTLNEEYFEEYVELNTVQEGNSYIELIDGAKVIDLRTGILETGLGTITKDFLSTGTKTVLNLLYMNKYDKLHSIDITGCGQNAIDAIFEIQEQTDNQIRIYLRHKAIAGCRDVPGREYSLNNGESLSNIRYLAAHLMKGD